jgi:uncharacterized protein (TIGR00297 family)
MPAETALPALCIVLVGAVIARVAKALDTSGAVASCAVGGAVAVGLGLAGLAPLVMFFVAGSAATRVGWQRKKAEGTAERGGGARGAGRVLAKGGVAAISALWPAACAGPAMAGALAAALGDTLGTEFGTLARGKPRLLPTFRAVDAGTPGAVSLEGTAAAVAGALLVAAAGAATGLFGWGGVPLIAAAGLVGALGESLIAGLVPAFAEAPGTLRNVLTTAVGATAGGLAFAGGLVG